MASKNIRKLARRQYEGSTRIPFQPLFPLSLKESVSNKSSLKKERICISELTVMLQCLRDSDHNQMRCSDAISKFNSCVASHQKEELERSSTNRDITTTKNLRDLKPQEINSMLKKFPPS